MNPWGGCRCFLQGPRLLFQPQSNTALGQYHIIMFGDRGTCVWTTCPVSLHESGMVRSQTKTRWSLDCKYDCL